MTARRAPARSRRSAVARKRIEPFELLVHPDAQRLKCAGGRIDPGIATVRLRPPNDARQPAGRIDGMFRSGPDERGGNAAGKSFFAVLKNRIGKLSLG